MDAFFKYFYHDMGMVLRSLWEIFVSAWHFLCTFFNFPRRMQILRGYYPSFETVDWILLVIAELVTLAIVVLLAVLAVKGLRKLLRFRVPVKEHEQLKAEVRRLTRQVHILSYQKEKLVAEKAAELAVAAEQEAAAEQAVEAAAAAAESAAEQSDKQPALV